MQEITVNLSDEQTARLREIAQRLAITPEQAAAELLGEQLASSATPSQAVASTHLTSALGLSGLVDDPSITPLTAAEIHRLLAAESLDAHDEHAE